MIGKGCGTPSMTKSTDLDAPDVKVIYAQILSGVFVIAITQEEAAMGSMTKEQFNVELQKGTDDISAGRVISADTIGALE